MCCSHSHHTKLASKGASPPRACQVLLPVCTNYHWVLTCASLVVWDAEVSQTCPYFWGGHRKSDRQDWKLIKIHWEMEQWRTMGIPSLPSPTPWLPAVFSMTQWLKAWSLEPGTWVGILAPFLHSCSCENGTMDTDCHEWRVLSAGYYHCVWGPLHDRTQSLQKQKLTEWPKKESDKHELVYLFLDARLFVYLSSTFPPTYGL